MVARQRPCLISTVKSRVPFGYWSGDYPPQYKTGLLRVLEHGELIMSRHGSCRTPPVRFSLCICQIFLLCAVAIAHAATENGVIQVKGTGTDLLNGAIVHLKRTTPTGEIQKSTEIVELRGDLNGKILYHVTTVINNSKGTLVNTGDQVFSGTISGSEPVMIHDYKFRFEVNLATGADSGSVYLLDHIAGPKVQCKLHVTGTGKNADGNPTFSYVGTCHS
jgi:hypothetical protein